MHASRIFIANLRLCAVTISDSQRICGDQTYSDHVCGFISKRKCFIASRTHYLLTHKEQNSSYSKHKGTRASGCNTMFSLLASTH